MLICFPGQKGGGDDIRFRGEGEKGPPALRICKIQLRRLIFCLNPGRCVVQLLISLDEAGQVRFQPGPVLKAQPVVPEAVPGVLPVVLPHGGDVVRILLQQPDGLYKVLLSFCADIRDGVGELRERPLGGMELKKLVQGAVNALPLLMQGGGVGVQLSLGLSLLPDLLLRAVRDFTFGNLQRAV